MSYLDPPANFSQRFHVKNQQRRKTPEDEALETHIHGSLFPFESQPFNPCFSVQVPSRKVKAYARGTFTTSTGAAGSDGWGYLISTPFASNNPAATYLNYSNGGVLPYDNFTNPVAVAVTNSPYTAAEFGTGLLNQRIASYSIRVRNITPMLNRGGTLFALKTANDYDFNGAGGFNAIIGQLDVTGNAIRCDTSGNEWQTLSWCPRDSDQFEYTSADRTVNFSNSGIALTRNMAFVAQSPGPFGVGSTTAQTYEWEWCCHFDVISANNNNYSIHGATRGISHLQVAKANQIVNDLQCHPKIIKNPGSSQVAGFIADMIAAGQGAAEIVGAASDLVDRTAAIAPRVIASARALGAWL